MGLRDYLKSVSEKFPWSSSKLKFLTSLSFFIQVILGTTFVYTDIKFSNKQACMESLDELKWTNNECFN